MCSETSSLASTRASAPVRWCCSDVPPDSTVVGNPAHIIYREGKRVLITDPHDVQDPLSNVIIALAKEVKQLEERLERLDGQVVQAARELDEVRSLAAEDEEREHTASRYRLPNS